MSSSVGKPGRLQRLRKACLCVWACGALPSNDSETAWASPRASSEGRSVGASEFSAGLHAMVPSVADQRRGLMRSGSRLSPTSMVPEHLTAAPPAPASPRAQQVPPVDTPHAVHQSDASSTGRTRSHLPPIMRVRERRTPSPSSVRRALVQFSESALGVTNLTPSRGQWHSASRLRYTSVPFGRSSPGSGASTPGLGAGTSPGYGAVGSATRGGGEGAFRGLPGSIISIPASLTSSAGPNARSSRLLSFVSTRNTTPSRGNTSVGVAESVDGTPGSLPQGSPLDTPSPFVGFPAPTSPRAVQSHDGTWSGAASSINAFAGSFATVNPFVAPTATPGGSGAASGAVSSLGGNAGSALHATAVEDNNLDSGAPSPLLHLRRNSLVPHSSHGSSCSSTEILGPYIGEGLPAAAPPPPAGPHMPRPPVGPRRMFNLSRFGRGYGPAAGGPGQPRVNNWS